LELIDDLLELTTLKRGTTELTVEEFDPRDVLHEAIETVEGCPASVSLRVQEPPFDVPPMRSDRRKIVKILASFLSNAYKFTVRGEVVASLELRDDRMVYRVRDTGIGIPATAQKLVFDEFRQVDGSERRRYGGSGLGLALARQLARALGGDIALESIEGGGSTFSVELPCEPPLRPASAPAFGA
jgi:signal transduction histidine kinase